MIHTLSAGYKNVMLCPVSDDDLESLRVWRNDPENTRYLAKIDHITSGQQRKWYERDNADTDCYTFAIKETRILNKTVGSVALYNFIDKSAEFGRFLIGDINARGKGIGFLGTVLCLYIGFYKIGLSYITAYVHEENIPALKAYTKAGFNICDKIPDKNSGDELEIKVERIGFFEKHSFLSEIEIT